MVIWIFMGFFMGLPHHQRVVMFVGTSSAIIILFGYLNLCLTYVQLLVVTVIFCAWDIR